MHAAEAVNERSLRKPPRHLCFDFETPTPACDLREADIGIGVVGRLVYVYICSRMHDLSMLLLEAVKSFSFVLLAISLLKQAALLYSINRIDCTIKNDSA